MSAPRRPRREGNPGCSFLVIILIVVGIASFFAIARNADFPGADTIRTAGREGKELYEQARQRLGGDGAGEEEPPPVSTPTSVTEPASTSVAMATPRPALDPTDTPMSRPTLTPVSGPTDSLRPDQRHYKYKTYMLELINAERMKAGVPPVNLGDNIAAQLHAENSLANCFSGHWGVDGLKPYMRYSLASGYQANGENGSGSDYCIKASDRYRPLGSIEAEIREMTDGWMRSPGHRRNLLDKWHRKVNIGLAWDKYNILGYQHFESDYVEYDSLPKISNGTLSFSGHAINGLQFSGKEELGLQMYYDPPPHSLTRGQVSRTYCYNSGLLIAAFNHPLPGFSFWVDDELTTTYSPCPDPYDVSPDAPAPQSPEEAREFWLEAYEASQDLKEQRITVPWITASEWTAQGTDFSVTADVGELLSRHGPSVYTIMLWGEMDGESVPISQYSIFYEVEPPDTYNTDQWK